MKTLFARWSADSLVALSILSSALLVSIIAAFCGRYPFPFVYKFGWFIVLALVAIAKVHSDPGRSPRMRVAESIVASLAGAAFLFLAIYSFYERF